MCRWYRSAALKQLFSLALREWSLYKIIYTVDLCPYSVTVLHLLMRTMNKFISVASEMLITQLRLMTGLCLRRLRHLILLDVANDIVLIACSSVQFMDQLQELIQITNADKSNWNLFLLQRWNDTYAHFHKTDPKQTYYISMEYLQGRALTNAIGNLNLTDAYGSALMKLGYDLETIVEQVISDGHWWRILGSLEAHYERTGVPGAPVHRENGPVVNFLHVLKCLTLSI